MPYRSAHKHKRNSAKPLKARTLLAMRQTLGLLALTVLFHALMVPVRDTAKMEVCGFKSLIGANCLHCLPPRIIRFADDFKCICLVHF